MIAPHCRLFIGRGPLSNDTRVGICITSKLNAISRWRTRRVINQRGIVQRAWGPLCAMVVCMCCASCDWPSHIVAKCNWLWHWYLCAIDVYFSSRLPTMTPGGSAPTGWWGMGRKVGARGRETLARRSLDAWEGCSPKVMRLAVSAARSQSSRFKALTWFAQVSVHSVLLGQVMEFIPTTNSLPGNLQWLFRYFL